MGPLIVFINRSTLASDAECALMTAGCDLQLRQDVKPAWEADLRARNLPTDPEVRFARATDPIPKGSWPIYVLDDADQLGYLGWHSVDDRGVPFGRIFVRAARNARWPLSVLGSHEAAEALADPFVDVYREGYALESADPVEGDRYTVYVGATESEDGDEPGDPGVPVQVSNVVTPAWFKGSTPAGAVLDVMGRCTRPHEVRPGGYVMTQSAAAATVFGAGYPDWRVGAKLEPGSRTWRRAEALRGGD